MDFYELLNSREFVFLDGGFGTQLAARLDEMPEVPETVNITHPEIVSAIHRSYIDAGSDIVYTCTFGASRYKIARSGYSVSEIVKAAIANARKADISISLFCFSIFFMTDNGLVFIPQPLQIKT